MKRACVVSVAAVVLATVAGSYLQAQQERTTVRAFLERLRGLDPVACDLVGQALGNRWGHATVAPIVRLPGRSEETVETVRWALQQHDDGDMVPPLTAALGDPDACVRLTAARMFDRVRDRSLVIHALREPLRARSTTTQQAAVLALGYVEDPSAVPILTTRLTSGDPSLRQVTAWALGRIEHPDAIPALVRALRDPDVGVRGNAAFALGQIERPGAVAPLTSALDDRDVSVRINIAWALGKIEDASAIPALSDLLERDPNVDVRRAAAWALGRIE